MLLSNFMFATLVTWPLSSLGSVTFDVYLGAGQPSRCTGEELGEVTQGPGNGEPHVFINAGCILVESPDDCCTAVMYRYRNCTHWVGSLEGGHQGDSVQVNFACVQVLCGNDTLSSTMSSGVQAWV
ncbi:hypothetical protein LTR97_000119 [Elasticomyces elasticus]|uniref:Hydrophobin n=1 Tax=Elasticomyces elasticus TaxID=574655 RepID=A0AAN7ZQS4_9PEZI|nr:hypothetical protein LTR97_000119 [Elasticomyces elasticus]